MRPVPIVRVNPANAANRREKPAIASKAIFAADGINTRTAPTMVDFMITFPHGRVEDTC